MRRALSEGAERLLADRLPPEALGFAREVVRQLTHPLGRASHSPQAQCAAAESVIDLLAGAAGAGVPAAGAEQRLRTDPVLLAAVFQNLDVLFDHDHPHADRLALMVSDAIWSSEPDR